jgi:hypothetical protein
MMEEKDLFIPLKTEYFNAFKDGSKDTEYRPYGKRWNRETCYVGRKAVLSKGYGKYERLSGVVSRTKVLHASKLDSQHRKAVKEIYGTLDIDIFCIQFSNLKQLNL